MFAYSKITTQPVPLPVPHHIAVLKSPAPWWKERKAIEARACVEKEMKGLIDGLEALVRNVRNQAQEPENDIEPEQVIEPVPTWVKLTFLAALLCLAAAFVRSMIDN